MAKRKKRKNKNKSDFSVDVTAISLVVVGVVLSIFVYGTENGFVGGLIKNLMLGCIGNVMYAIPAILIFLGIYAAVRDFSKLKVKTFLIVITVFLSSAIMSTFKAPMEHIATMEAAGNLTAPFEYIAEWCKMGLNGLGGGLIGSCITYSLKFCIGMVATKVILWALLIVVGSFITGITFSAIIQAIKESVEDAIEISKQEFASRPVPAREKTRTVTHTNSEKFRNIISQTNIDEDGQVSLDLDDESIYEDDYDDEEELYDQEENGIDEEEQEEIQKAKEKRSLFKKKMTEAEDVNKEESDDEDSTLEIDTETTEVEEYANYVFPSIELLKEAKRNGRDNYARLTKETKRKLQETLQSFGVNATVGDSTRGPTVTRFEIHPESGVKVSKILNLSDDLALNLAAKSIRIEAPIPGKSAIGIEIPNQVTDMVTLRELVEAPEFENAPSKVSFALGKSIDGNVFVADISKMPHMLISGSTGSGKSVCINSIIMSLMYKSKPNEVKLILIDPKVVELSVYNGIPHLLIPVVTDPKKAAGALNWAVQEMENRYNIFASKGVRNIKGYNEAIEKEGSTATMPQIVIVVDELADLMMVASKEVEDAICRLAQKARAAGMYLIIATQRPSVDVITGIIKANIPSRIAFTVSSQIDSRTILDAGGAEKLLGKGDMLFLPIGESKPIRLQGAFVSDSEIENVVEAVKEFAPATYDENVLGTIEKVDVPQSGNDSDDDCDELLHDAIELAINMDQISASMIQRKFRVGYARAGRIVDQMEERGIISESQGSKPRKVLISKEEWENMNESGDTSYKVDDTDDYLTGTDE